MIPELHHYHLADEVTAFSTTRHGGYSQGGYGAFNVNLFCGDDVEAIQKNRQLLCQSLAIQPDRLLMPHQVHGVEVRRITQDVLNLSVSERQAVLEGVDALMTDVKEVCIGVSTADCIPLIIYDPEHTAASVIHACARNMNCAGTTIISEQGGTGDSRNMFLSRSLTLCSFRMK